MHLTGKYVRSIFMAVVMILSMLPYSGVLSAQEREVKVYINGNLLESDVPPMIIDNYVYVPMRAIFEAHGAVVTWHEEYRLVEAITRDHLISYSVDGDFIQVDMKRTPLEQKAVIVNNRTLVPIRVISEALGSDVQWDDGKSIVTITTVAPPKPPAERPRDLNLSLTAANRQAQRASDSNSSFSLNVRTYGVKDNRFYTSLEFKNYQAKAVLISFDAGDKRILQELAKPKDPMPDIAPEDCTRVTTVSISDGVTGKINNVPEFSTDAACTARNAEKQAKFEEWARNNRGISEVGSEMVSVRQAVQAADGSLKDFVIPAGASVSFIVQKDWYGEASVTLSGSYYTEGSEDQAASIHLAYETNKDMGLGDYDFYFTNTIF